MKLSKKTLAVLKNFSSINQNMIFKGNNVLRTMSIQTNIFATAEIDEAFPVEFAVYDLGQFLNTLSLFNEPEITFHDNYTFFTIAEGNQNVRYVSSDPFALTSPEKDNKKIVLADEAIEVSFELSKDILEQINRSSGILSLTDFGITDKGLKVYNRGSDSGNQFTFDVDFTKKPKGAFEYVIKVANLKFIPTGYTVDVKANAFARFTSIPSDEVSKMEYFVALEVN